MCLAVAERRCEQADQVGGELLVGCRSNSDREIGKPIAFLHVAAPQ